MSQLTKHRKNICDAAHAPEQDVLDTLKKHAEIDAKLRTQITASATQLVNDIRGDTNPGIMEVFLAEYGLSTDEGVALMCLAEALLRVPDAETVDALIEDKIAPSSWGEHLGKSSSSLVNASTWALMLTGKVLQDGTGMASTLRSAVKRIGEPVIRVAVSRAMKELGAQFVLGETIKDAVKRGKKRQADGYTYSYDMLGEAALTAKDADGYFEAYRDAITQLAAHSTADDIRENPGISIKLSALHPRYEVGQYDRVMRELVPRVLILAKLARDAGMGLNIDAEEADRLDISLDVIEAVLADPSLIGWDGFGVVVQAYGKRAALVLDWLYTLAETHDRKIMVRLVKGAYWDTEIKRAQVEGLPDFPVFTQKAATDVSYLCCAQKLLGMTDRIYPQFATHNAHSVAAILEMATDKQTFEFQRLHGMGASLHDLVLEQNKTRCRIYAPVGAHEDLLAYLVRRLLENGANSSFVNQIVDEEVPSSTVAADPFAALKPASDYVKNPSDLYAPERVNSRGWDLHDETDLTEIAAAREPFKTHQWTFDTLGTGEQITVTNPIDTSDIVGQVTFCNEQDVAIALANATAWDADAGTRAKVLNNAADLYEQNFGQLFAVLAREAGKTAMDAISELREAVDFLRYYAARASEQSDPARGVFACISPWNFPLAIFTGQISAALAAGNGVIAKPAEPTTLTAIIAANLLHKAGVPNTALHLLPGRGRVIGSQITSDPRIAGVCFTGSTATAQTINKSMAAGLSPTAPLIAETGGLNAMIVDSTALPEQAIVDVVTSAFQSAGQRCSALRMLYLQEDIAEQFLEMLYGAMDELVVGDPWDMQTDLGPVITPDAQSDINNYITQAQADGRLLKRLKPPKFGTFVPPTVIKVRGITDLEKEVFGPVLHIATFGSEELDAVIAEINATGFGLTFGIHSRIDDRVDQVTRQMTAGNIYVNRNQIGAIVGSQPFGGEGMSGTGPKAGGPSYVPRFTQPGRTILQAQKSKAVDGALVQDRLNAAPLKTELLSTLLLPGPTGESNQLSEFGRGKVLCLGPTKEAALQQADIARTNGCEPICVAPDISAVAGLSGHLAATDLAHLKGFDAVVSYASDDELTAYRNALSGREGKLIPLFSESDLDKRLRLERHVCIDTTAAGGNASLLAEAH